jgi:protein involved in polysaccharide export with SLBB domain
MVRIPRRVADAGSCTGDRACRVRVFEPCTGDRGRAAADSGHSQAPRLQSGEKIRVTVYNEPSLSGDFQIDPSGFVSLPLAGTLKAGA